MKKEHPITPVSAGRLDLPAPPSGTSTRGGSDSSSTTGATPTCPQCQATLSGEARFCHLCGAPLTGPCREAITAEAGELVAAGRPMPLSASVMINRDEVLELIEGSIERLPDELKAARWLLKERDEYLAKIYQAQGENP